jgi:adsorption protein B
MTAVDVVPLLLVVVKALLIVLGVIFAISGLDDFFVDVCYTGHFLRRWLVGRGRDQTPTEEELRTYPEQLIAVMIPAWDESAVIRPMLENTLRTIDYSNYHVFVGTYPNDPATHREVERVRERFANVHRIVCPKDGPTNKADCLNWVYQGIQLFEREHRIRFEVLVMSDSEDIVHPLHLKLLNYRIPRAALVQLPVMPLESGWSQFTEGHYLDEFAEHHSKDVTVRQMLTGTVPSAGVGTGFSREALEKVAASHERQLFSIDSLTEDYDVSFRLREHQLKQEFVWYAVPRREPRHRWWRRNRIRPEDYVAIREHFPATPGAAVRQKSRWMVGIALQGWANLGWRGGLWTKYLLFRDRKGLLTSQVTPLGYLIVLAVVSIWIRNWLVTDSYRYPPLVEIGSWLWYLVLVNGFFLTVRVLQRASSVQRLYGWRQATLSIPRQVWSNLINWAAGARAIRLYARYLRTGQLIRWDKTSHVFPSEEQLRTFRRKLGDLLLERRHLTVQQLDEALATQTLRGRRLGEVLVELGVVTEDEVVSALGVQLHLPVRDLAAAPASAAAMALVPCELALEYSVLPLDLQSGGLSMATADPPSPEQLQMLERSLGCPIALCLCTPSQFTAAVDRAYGGFNHPALVKR